MTRLVHLRPRQSYEDTQGTKVIDAKTLRAFVAKTAL
jgi:hypothetical protein